MLCCYHLDVLGVPSRGTWCAQTERNLLYLQATTLVGGISYDDLVTCSNSCLLKHFHYIRCVLFEHEPNLFVVLALLLFNKHNSVRWCPHNIHSNHLHWTIFRDDSRKHIKLFLWRKTQRAQHTRINFNVIVLLFVAKLLFSSANFFSSVTFVWTIDLIIVWLRFKRIATPKRRANFSYSFHSIGSWAYSQLGRYIMADAFVNIYHLPIFKRPSCSTLVSFLVI